MTTETYIKINNTLEKIYTQLATRDNSIKLEDIQDAIDKVDELVYALDGLDIPNSCSLSNDASTIGEELESEKEDLERCDEASRASIRRANSVNDKFGLILDELSEADILSIIEHIATAKGINLEVD